MLGLSRRGRKDRAASRRVSARRRALKPWMDGLEDRVVLAASPVISWVGGAAGDWNVAGNWSGNAVPTASDDVEIGTATVTVAAGATAYAKNLTTSADTTLKFASGASLSGGSSAPGLFTNAGTIDAVGNSNIGIKVDNQGSILVGTGATLDLSSQGLANYTGATLDGGNYEVKGTLVVPGAIRTLAGAGNVTLDGAGASIKHGSDFNALGALGTIRQEASLTIRQQAFSINQSLTNNGSLALEAGKLTLNEGFTNNGSVTIGIAGTTAGIGGYGQLNVDLGANLGGELRIELMDGHAPASLPGSYSVVVTDDFGFPATKFASVTRPSLPSGLVMDEGVYSNTALTFTISALTLESITVSPASTTIAKGLTKQFTATANYQGGSTADLTDSVVWTAADSSGSGVASIDASTGLAKGLNVGTATITAAYGGKTGSATLNVDPAALVSIAITPNTTSVAKGRTVQFTATGTYTDDSTKDITKTVSWSTSAVTIASIDANGLATSQNTGSAKITASSPGVVSNEATLTVTDAVLDSITVTAQHASVAKGRTSQFTAKGIYSDGTTSDNLSGLAWTSDKAGVASVDSATGLAKGEGVGSAAITATVGSISGSAGLTVTAAVLDSITVTAQHASVAKGRTSQFTATGIYSDGTTSDNLSGVVWTSDKAGVASVDSVTGLAKGEGEGSAAITATVGSISGSAGLTVTAAALDSITISPANETIYANSTQAYTATGTYSDGSTDDVTGLVSWSSSATSVATIDSSTGLATGVGAGQTTISASRAGVTTATTTLKVEALAQVDATSVSWGALTAPLKTDGVKLVPAERTSTPNLTIGWAGIDRVNITLSKAITLTAANITVSSAGGYNYGAITLEGSESGTEWVIKLENPINSADRVTFTIDALGMESFTRRLDVLPGDVDGDGMVTMQDVIYIRNGVQNVQPIFLPIYFLDILGEGEDTPTKNSYNFARLLVGSQMPPLS